MAVERTLSIIKPDATRRNLTGAINERFERSGLRIVAQKRLRLTQEMAERFYAVHAQRPFYNSLVGFMISGPVVAQVLEGENAVARNREVMGATDPAKADPGTIRKDFAEFDRSQLGAWLGLARERGAGDRVLLLAGRDLPLKSSPRPLEQSKNSAIPIRISTTTIRATLRNRVNPSQVWRCRWSSGSATDIVRFAG